MRLDHLLHTVNRKPLWKVFALNIINFLDLLHFIPVLSIMKTLSKTSTGQQWLSGGLLQEPRASAHSPTSIPCWMLLGQSYSLSFSPPICTAKALVFFQSAVGISHVCHLLQCGTGRIKLKLKVAEELHESVEYRNSRKRKDALLDTYFLRKVGHLLCLRKDWQRKGARFTSLASLGDKTKKVETGELW